jgi:hypothetical protein
MYNEKNKYGVLNDFDLSTIMNPGDRNPNRRGFERTGTLPFMALELLENEGFDGKVPRRYEHELESFSWVLVWVSRCVLGGQESRRPRRLAEWLGNDNDEVYKSKLAFVLDQRKLPMTSDYESLGIMLETWVMDNFQRLLTNQLSFQTHSNKKTDTEHLRALIALCKRCAEKNPRVAVPIDATWIDGLADLKFTAPSHLPL